MIRAAVIPPVCDVAAIDLYYCHCSLACGHIMAARCRLCPQDSAQVWERFRFVRQGDRGGDEALGRMFARIGVHLVEYHPATTRVKG